MRKIVLDKDELCKYLNKGLTKSYVSKCFGVSIETLNKNLKLYNLVFDLYGSTKGKNKKESIIDEKWLTENWINTDFSLNELSKKFGVSEPSLWYKVKKYKLKKQFKRHINIEKFKDLSDPHLWYIFGLVATDGYLPKCGNCLTIGLCGESEKELLTDICLYYESSFKPTYHKFGNSYMWRCAFEGLNDFLEQNANIPRTNKTSCVGVPKSFPNIDCVKAYILGCIDGDGNIDCKRRRLRIVTLSSDFIDGLINIILNYTNIQAYRFSMKNKKRECEYPGLCIQGKKFLDFMKWVYSTSCSFKLKRKYLSYKKCELGGDADEKVS